MSYVERLGYQSVCTKFATSERFPVHFYVDNLYLFFLSSNIWQNDVTEKLSRLTDGYSNSDITNLAKDAAMAPLREMSQVGQASLTSITQFHYHLWILTYLQTTLLLLLLVNM